MTKLGGRLPVSAARPGDRPVSHDPLDQIAWLMDRAIRVPGTPIRVGLDALLGLLPVGGDVLTGVVQVGIVLVALYRYKVPKAVAARMAANVLLDVGVGSIPLLGDVFDVFFKANTRNLHLLQQVRQQQTLLQPVSTGSSKLFLLAIAVVLLAALALVVVGFITVVMWLVHRPLV